MMNCVAPWASWTQQSNKALLLILPRFSKSKLIFRHSVVFSLPIKQVKNKLPVVKTLVESYRPEGHPTSG